MSSNPFESSIKEVPAPPTPSLLEGIDFSSKNVFQKAADVGPPAPSVDPKKDEMLNNGLAIAGATKADTSFDFAKAMGAKAADKLIFGDKKAA